ncbi:hypothetical protein [Amycolatopsis vastitatis]|uniref:Uncharacterized protein n=1 Tax=Amycolatopsis vastitatis TaxID=1905142 RepID=A0A229TEE1_9PSEU|nr:hypothetical protein [Amycolatopsis vastitatis]OXM69625.1 hypothetical protein CF165_08945 [Amycolatopsis vastitatis]
MLIEHLPPTSAFHRAVHGHAWSDVEYLLAIVADRLGENTFVTGRAAGMKGVRRPRPLSRPGEEDKDRIGDRGEADTEDVIAYLDQYKPRPAA